MGLLTRAFADAAPLEQRDWFTDDDFGPSSWTASGVRVDRETALSLSAVWRCVKLLTDTVSTLPTKVFLSLRGQEYAQYDRPFWLSYPVPSNPSVSAMEHFAQVATSLLIEGNAFVYVDGGIYDPRQLVVLDPRLVSVEPGPRYVIRDAQGQTIATTTPFDMLHASLIRLPGAPRGLSPLEAMRRSVGLGIAQEDFGARFFGQGASLSFGVEVPGSLTKDQKTELAEALKARYAGVRNSHAIGVLTAGAKFVQGLAPTPEQSQFLASRKFSVEDIARWFGVPPHLVGSQDPGASSYASVEQRSLEFREYGVLPLARRIEDPYQRLLAVPTAVTDPTAEMKFRFNLDAMARADLKTRFDTYEAGIRSGVLKPDEARALENLSPVPGGDKVYMQAQMQPLGMPLAPGTAQ